MKPMMRLAIVPLCFALAGCLTTDEPAPASNQPAQPAAAASPAPAPDKPAAAPGQRRSQPAATRGANAPPVPPQASEPPTDPIMEIRQTCWSQGNANKSFKSLEARADWVNKCITDKTKAL